MPFKIRETIAKLVKYHGLPMDFLKKENLEKTIFEASQMVRLDLVAILSKADALGRIAKDLDELLEKNELFKAFCIENECFDKPKAFPNNFSRFEYFSKENRYIGFEAYDDTKFEVILMSGLPASGKDTWVAKNCNHLPIISLDDLREELDIKPEDEQGTVIQQAKENAKILMREQKSFVWNATNITRQMRKQLIDLFINYGARVKIVYIEAEYEEIIRRNDERNNPVPEKVINKMIEKLEVPEVIEAHEVFYLKI